MKSFLGQKKIQKQLKCMTLVANANKSLTYLFYQFIFHWILWQLVSPLPYAIYYYYRLFVYSNNVVFVEPELLKKIPCFTEEFQKWKWFWGRDERLRFHVERKRSSENAQYEICSIISWQTSIN
jgi:hypothetical protein